MRLGAKMLTLFGRETSSNVQAVRWALEELGLVYERVDVGGSFGGLDAPALRAMNPHGRIPVLQDGSAAIFETGAILRYLAAAYGDDVFWPTDPLARARVDQWAEWGKIEVAEKFTGPVFWRVVRTPAARRDPVAIRAAVDRLEGELAVAEAVLAGRDWLAGPDFTLADIAFGHVLFRYFDIDIARRDLPALAAYHDRLAARPAYRSAVMVSYDVLRDTL